MKNIINIINSRYTTKINDSAGYIFRYMYTLHD